MTVIQTGGIATSRVKRSDIDVTEVIHGYIAPFVVVLSIYETFILLYIGCESVNPVFDHL